MDFIDSLNEMLSASPRNSRKNAPVLSWFENNIYGSGRASVISEEKQVGNRISEQFKHKSEHVIFVCYDEKTMETTKRRVHEFLYSELCSVTIIVTGLNHQVTNKSDVFYICYRATDLINFYEANFSNLEVIQHGSENTHIGYLEASRVNKPFLLLAGISGTGKTRFVREQAKASKQLAETYCLTSVRPDWHEPSDLLGYISRLNGAAEYITTDVLQFISKAWRAIADSALTVEVEESEDQGERLVVAGERDELEKVLPYWLCLDEMNLAPVEQYFADYLSVLETREWHWAGDSFTYSSDALLKPATIKEVADKEKLREALGFDDAQYDALWADICQYGLSIPFNLLVAGTVNMDETTHGFSRKVIDRALSFDFGAFFPNDYNDFFTPTIRNKRLSYPIWSHASKADLANTFDADGTKTVAFLSAVNSVLKNTPFELAFRALNELLLAVASSQPQDELTLKAVWDDFMMCKVLPRIEGDEDKLVGHNEKIILEELLKVLEQQLGGAWETGRPDLYREKLNPEGETIIVNCRSKKKLSWMNAQLVRGFTSFWP